MKEHLADARTTKNASAAKTDPEEAGGKKKQLCNEFYGSDNDEDEFFKSEGYNWRKMEVRNYSF